MKIKDTNKTNSVASKSSLKQNLVLPELTKEEEKQEYQEKLSGEIRVALIGNPNCGQTTLFNAITGTHQYVGNWPGVTVEKKEGHYKRDKRIKFVDLPGVYSLSAHVNDELLAREFLLSKECGIILNVIDATNLERGLYLTQQLCELGKPIIIALNMMDVVTKRGYLINQEKLAQKLAVDVVKVSGQQEQGIESLIDTIKKVSTKKKKTQLAKFSHKTENYLAQIERLLPSNVPTELIRYFSIKAFENDPALPNQIKEIEEIRIVSNAAKSEFGEENSETITNERYMYITSFIGSVHKHAKSSASVSEKIDRILLNRIFAIPIFIIIMAIVYFIAVSSIGSAATQWVSSGLFGDGFFLGPYDPQFDIDMQNNLSQSNNALKPNPSDYGLFILGIPVILENALNAIQCAEWLQSLVLNGIVAGVGAVLSFIPQIFLLFFMLAILENCGYLARVAFILDKIFRRFGLNGKSFIPMLIGTGCGVPAILATRTIENESSRRLTIMTTTFMPCSAKLPIIALISGSLFGGNPIIAPSCYFIGISAIILSSVILKKTKPFLQNQKSSIMELPSYSKPQIKELFRSAWSRTYNFIKQAGTIILLGCVAIWFLANLGIENGSFGMVEDMENSILGFLGKAIAWIFIPCGFGDWQAAVATLAGFLGKENLVSTLGVLYANGGLWANLAAEYTAIAGMAFMLFNLLCAPCIAAMATIKKELRSTKWFVATIAYQCTFAYVVALCTFQIGSVAIGQVTFNLATAIALICIVTVIYLLFRQPKKS